MRGGLWRNFCLACRICGSRSFRVIQSPTGALLALVSPGSGLPGIAGTAFNDVVGRSAPCRLDTVAVAPARAAPAPAGEDISMGRRHFSVAQCRISFPSHRVCPHSSHRLGRHLAKHTLAARCGGSGGSGVPACARAPCGAAQRCRRRRHSRSGLRRQGGQAARSDSGATRPGSAGEL